MPERPVQAVFVDQVLDDLHFLGEAAVPVGGAGFGEPHVPEDGVGFCCPAAEFSAEVTVPCVDEGPPVGGFGGVVFGGRGVDAEPDDFV